MKDSCEFRMEVTIMPLDERERMNELCILIQTEQDPGKFDQLVKELNNLMEVKYERIHTEHKPAESDHNHE
jgi:hypothetical protein